MNLESSVNLMTSSFLDCDVMYVRQPLLLCTLWHFLSPWELSQQLYHAIIENWRCPSFKQIAFNVIGLDKCEPNSQKKTVLHAVLPAVLPAVCPQFWRFFSGWCLQEMVKNCCGGDVELNKTSKYLNTRAVEENFDDEHLAFPVSRGQLMLDLDLMVPGVTYLPVIETSG